MTTAEAICIMNSARGMYNGTAIHALDLAVEALKARTPEKVKNVYDYKILKCPHCDSDRGLWNNNGMKNTFCGECGQHLDWEVL